MLSDAVSLTGRCVLLSDVLLVENGKHQGGVSRVCEGESYEVTGRQAGILGYEEEEFGWQSCQMPPVVGHGALDGRRSFGPG